MQPAQFGYVLNNVVIKLSTKIARYSVQQGYMCCKSGSCTIVACFFNLSILCKKLI